MQERDLPGRVEVSASGRTCWSSVRTADVLRDATCDVLVVPPPRAKR